MTTLEIKNVSSFLPQEVTAALLAPSRVVRFRYALLDANNQPKGFLAGVQPGGRVTYNYLADVKRTGDITIKETLDIPEGWLNYESINFSLDRLQIYVQFQSGDEWISFPLGVFLMESGSRTGVRGSRSRAVKLYDLARVLRDDKVLTRYAVTAGTNIITAVTAVLNSAKLTDQNLTACPTTMTTDRSWDPGTQKIQIINDLLDSINYGSLFFDENGTAVARPYTLPALRTPDVEYVTDSVSVLTSEATEIFETFGIPNVWTITVSQPDRPILTATYTNDSPTSPTSTVSRGRSIVDFRTEAQAHSQSELDNMVRRIAHEASQVYAQFEFQTAIMPIHGENTAVRISHNSMGVQDTFIETQWDITLRAGSLMRHLARKVIDVDA